MSTRIDRIRGAVLRAEPFCRRCAATGADVPAVAVAPIVPIDQGGKMARRNFQPVCARHATISTRAPALARILNRRLRQKEAEARMQRGK